MRGVSNIDSGGSNSFDYSIEFFGVAPYLFWCVYRTQLSTFTSAFQPNPLIKRINEQEYGLHDIANVFLTISHNFI